MRIGCVMLERLIRAVRRMPKKTMAQRRQRLYTMVNARRPIARNHPKGCRWYAVRMKSLYPTSPLMSERI